MKKILLNHFFFNFIKKKIDLKKNYIKIMNRNFFITLKMVGLKVAVYNGYCYIPLRITSNMVGRMLGVFAFSKRIYLKKIDKYKKRKKVK